MVNSLLTDYIRYIEGHLAKNLLLISTVIKHVSLAMVLN